MSYLKETIEAEWEDLGGWVSRSSCPSRGSDRHRDRLNRKTLGAFVAVTEEVELLAEGSEPLERFPQGVVGRLVVDDHLGLGVVQRVDDVDPRPAIFGGLDVNVVAVGAE